MCGECQRERGYVKRVESRDIRCIIRRISLSFCKVRFGYALFEMTDNLVTLLVGSASLALACRQYFIEALSICSPQRQGC